MDVRTEHRRLLFEIEKAFGGEASITARGDQGAPGHFLATVDESPERGMRSISTIALSDFEISKQVQGLPLRVELVAAAPTRLSEALEDMVSHISFNIILDSYPCYPEAIYHDVVAHYLPESPLRHIIMLDPFLWPELDTLRFSDRIVTWLMVAPISDPELQFYAKSGFDALVDLMEKHQVDVTDYLRPSIL